LLIESRALAVVLDRAPPDAFDRPSVCTGWSVRDVLAHCGAALGALVNGTLGSFTPEENQRDVDERAAWPLARVLDELFSNYAAAATIVEQAGGGADGLGLGEWIHGGDVRQPLGEADAYASAGVDLAIPLISERSSGRGAPAVEAVVDGRPIPFGSGPFRGRLVTDTATFVRLVAGRAPDPARYELSGDLTVDDLRLFS
jgi:uncharacterized protein (TIGR03083 family)